MGSIHRDVRSYYLKENPEMERIYERFTALFDITWAKNSNTHNTYMKCFFAKAAPDTAERFGLEKEILVAYSSHRELEIRSLSALSEFLYTEPAKSRTEPLIVILISKDPDVKNRMSGFRTNIEFANSIIAISKDDLFKSPLSDLLSKILFARDLFNMKLPLQSEHFFFGRDQLLRKLYNELRKPTIRGVFGLRKTGKTSILYSIKRNLSKDDRNSILMLDCKMPYVRNKTWSKLLNHIGDKFALDVGYSWASSEEPDEELMNMLESRPNKHFVLMLDEIEYISPQSPLGDTWSTDFVDFWQSIWGALSKCGNFACVIAGVNAGIAEKSTINATQNPLFGIVGHDYIKGLTETEQELMLSVLGPKLGLHFDHEASQLLHSEFGGHPFLTRLACSKIHEILVENQTHRPTTLKASDVHEHMSLISEELVFYGSHVIDVLQEFYPEEYEMLEILARGDTADFIELSKEPSWIGHLNRYGLFDASEGYRISINIVGQYLRHKARSESKTKTIQRLIEPSHRQAWLSRRISNVIAGMREFEDLMDKEHGISLYGRNSFPNADQLLRLPLVVNENHFSAFINTMNKCFVESMSVENGNAFFFSALPGLAPKLHRALHRVRLYRNERSHLKLTSAGAKDMYVEFLSQDLEGRNPASVDELWFTLQQCVLDGLHNSIQTELAQLSR